MYWMTRKTPEATELSYIDHGYDFDKLYNRMFNRAMWFADTLLGNGYNVFILGAYYDSQIEVKLQDRTTLYTFQIVEKL